MLLINTVPTVKRDGLEVGKIARRGWTGRIIQAHTPLRREAERCGRDDDLALVFATTVLITSVFGSYTVGAQRYQAQWRTSWQSETGTSDGSGTVQHHNRAVGEGHIGSVTNHLTQNGTGNWYQRLGVDGIANGTSDLIGIHVGAQSDDDVSRGRGRCQCIARAV